MPTDCNEIKGERFTRLETKLFVSNVLAEDRGNYVCQTILLHSGKKYKVLNGITVSTSTTLIVDCNITDTKDNTNLRCWRVNNTLVDVYYNESKRIREGVETDSQIRDKGGSFVGSYCDEGGDFEMSAEMCEQRASTLLNAMSKEPENFRASLLSTCQRLSEPHQYCGHSLPVVTVNNTKISEIDTEHSQTQAFPKEEVAMLPPEGIITRARKGQRGAEDGKAGRICLMTEVRGSHKWPGLEWTPVCSVAHLYWLH
ncbi:hypothetical protein P7K49_029562 [Saguinus oedipus]|uniref:Uncharacterized protein n=1 Tax=Saguinus oedipus TaxID=9490 RepID=A0ABQ9U7K4_SAGOE|nr:hypothetical protein P7K49_029562 [Saguinus oedipus]